MDIQAGPHGPIITEAGHHTLGQSLETGEAKLADAVVLRAVRDLLSPRTSQRNRADVVRFFETGQDLYWLRGGSADSEEQVRARHAKLLELVEQTRKRENPWRSELSSCVAEDVEEGCWPAFTAENPRQGDLFATA